jgi:uncharacterized protein YqgC (DUF456 family)
VSETLLMIAALVLMGIGVILSVVPFLPGPLLVWAIGVVFAVIDGFERVTYLSVALMTLVMVAGSTTEFWAPALGFKAEGGSCLTTVGSILGGIIGTIFIPIPFLGTLAGMMLGALLFEFMRIGEWREALDAGRLALKFYIVGALFEVTASLLIFAIFAASLWLTG